jgi:ferritin-like metal-binding protein YciE
LHSAEKQLRDLTNELARVTRNAPLATRIRQYASEVDQREEYLDGLLSRIGGRERKHPDDAMQALIRETHKMMRVSTESVRDAAVAASLQRIIHYKIAGYGTIAAYAKAIDRHEEAAHFHQLAEEDKRTDQELSELAKRALNPEAARRQKEQQQQQYQQQSRPH